MTASKCMLVAGESEAEFAAHVQGVVSSLKASNYLERALAARVAWALWRLRRCDRYTALLAKHLREDAPRDVEGRDLRFAGAALTPRRARALSILPARVANILKYEAALGCELQRLLRELRRLKDLHQTAESGNEATSPSADG